MFGVYEVDPRLAVTQTHSWLDYFTKKQKKLDVLKIIRDLCTGRMEVIQIADLYVKKSLKK